MTRICDVAIENDIVPIISGCIPIEINSYESREFDSITLNLKEN